MKNNKGKLEAVMNIKNSDYPTYHGDLLRNGIAVDDVERGQLSGINPLPWQTDDSIGDWFWTNGDKYNTPKYVIDQLIDIVSKNGNLLLNVPPREDGTLDDKAISLLEEIGKWLKTNGEGIYGTRPFSLFGEGPTTVTGGHFKRMAELTAQDFRFTTKGDTVYAFVCGLPEKNISIKAFSGVKYHKVKSVRMLGVEHDLKFVQTNGALEIDMPDNKPCDFAVCLKIVPVLNPVPGSLSKY